MRVCDIPDCTKINYGKGYCKMHYLRTWRRGDPNIVLHAHSNYHGKTLKEIFESKFIRGNDNECWDWKGYLQKGYGHIRYKSKKYTASRLSYELYVGSLDSKMSICHTCHRPICVNPNHLYLGTHQENMQDMVVSNRAAKGENHSQSKLTESKTKYIKLELTNGQSVTELAKKYNVSKGTISMIKNNKIWRHI